jgi:hypothetical protein
VLCSPLLAILRSSIPRDLLLSRLAPETCICRPLDAAGVMDTMHESHTGQLLPRLEAGGAVLAQFAEHCLDCKVRRYTNGLHRRPSPLLCLAAPCSSGMQPMPYLRKWVQASRRVLHTMWHRISFAVDSCYNFWCNRTR